MQRVTRLKKEIEMFSHSPPYGISCWVKEDMVNQLEAQIIGGDGTPYEGGIFKLDIQVPERYPFEPPKLRFVTPIYHPNIDTAGRICLDTLKMPPKGAWKPCLNISTVLTSIQLLMAEPNPEDPLMTDISNEFKYNKPLYVETAKQWTTKYAKDHSKMISGKSIVKDVENASTSNKQKLSSSDSDPTGPNKRQMPMADVTNKRPKVT
ncbi:ubiquitin-conjugating enzyme E2 T-like [Gigantopelta aegis]|uniref:ubiquitin-conjugating enzyme E2 T-like n=1 Tax=Gigantopelta aegis TaxID=1735272 RepID=UPI001B8889BC|nr:ubiquitin-conjugating enzyme E2 T-like [Gigantopelta aegis]